MLFDADAWACGDAWRWLEGLRARGPVVRVGAGWVVLGHPEAVRVLTDARTFTSRFGTGRRHLEVPGRSLNLDDPPRSTALRRGLVLAPATLDLSPVDAFVARGGGDFVTEVAQPLALATFGSVVGLSGPLLDELGVLTRALARAEDGVAFSRADEALLAWLVTHREAPHPFFRHGAELEPLDQRFLLRLLAQTGHESTAMLLALSVDALLTAGAPFDASPCAVEELIRFTSPLVRFAREATTAVRLGDVEVAPGERVVVVFPLVNRDPRVFSQPDALVLDRPLGANAQLAFGAGPHACLGADLARAVLGGVLRALSRGPRLAVVGRSVLRSSVTRGLKNLSLRERGEVGAERSG